MKRHPILTTIIIFILLYKGGILSLFAIIAIIMAVKIIIYQLQ